ncbi:MAG: extracellular solute-binding protein, partial [Planctomycetota bacterium]
VVIRATDFVPSPDAAFTIGGKVDLAVYRAFRAKHPHIEPEAVPMGLKFEGAAGEAPLLMSIAGGTAPEVIQVNTRQSGSFIERRFLLPLDEFVKPETTAAQARGRGEFDPNVMYREELERRVLPSLMDAVYRLGPDGEKHVYCLPFSNKVRALAYRKDLFRKAGLDPERDYPKTWDELWRAAQKLHRPDEGYYGMLVDSGLGASWTALTFFYSMGSEVVRRDPATGGWTAAFNDKGAIEAADFYLKLVQGPWTDNRTGKERHGVGRSEDAWYLWDTGRVGMVLLYLDDTLINLDSHISAYTPQEIGIVPVPLSPKGTRATELHSRMLGITATTTDRAKIDGAWKFIRFVGSPEAKAAVTGAYVENGYGPYIAPEKLAASGHEEYLSSVPKQWADALETSFANCTPEPYGKNCQVYILRASKPMLAAISSDLGKDPDRAARHARLQELYDEAVAEVNEKMLGNVPPDEMRVRRIVAFILATVIFVMFVVLFVMIWRTFTPERLAAAAPKSAIRKFRMAYLLLTPAVFAILLFRYYPLVRGAAMAFQDYNVVGGSRFVGLDNFAHVIYDKVFWVSLLRSLQYAFWYLLLVFVPPICLAVMLSEIRTGRVFFRIVFYLPAVMASVVTLLMWKGFFDPSASGTLNRFIGFFGAGPRKWLWDESLAMACIIIPQGWAALGPGCLIYLAALKTVPPDLYEAMAVDGGGFFTRVRHLTLPTLGPLIVLQLIFALIGALQSADAVLVMTGGGPGDATNVIGLEIFYNAYVYLRFGIATAMAWVLGFLLIGFTVFQMRRLSGMTFKAAPTGGGA